MSRKKTHPLQPTFDEGQEIATNPHLQQLLQWYPDQRDRILQAYRRRNPHPGCTCSWNKRKPGRCCTLDHLPNRPRDRRRSRTPSAAGQYREQVQK